MEAHVPARVAGTEDGLYERINKLKTILNDRKYVNCRAFTSLKYNPDHFHLLA